MRPVVKQNDQDIRLAFPPSHLRDNWSLEKNTSRVSGTENYDQPTDKLTGETHHFFRPQSFNQPYLPSFIKLPIRLILKSCICIRQCYDSFYAQ
jgi:hypothetical protein